MLNIVREALKTIDNSTMPGNHHFYLAFTTTAPGVKIPDHLKSLHPKEMTIVLQYQFDGLEVNKNDFSVSLTFNGKKCKLVVPFKALTSFTDPSVNFAIKFRYFARTLKTKTPATTENNSISPLPSRPPLEITYQKNKSSKVIEKKSNNVIQFNKIKN